MPNWFPLSSEASIVFVTLIDVNKSTPLPIVENFNLNGILFPVNGVLAVWSNAPNFTLPSFECANINQVLGNSDFNSSNLILVAS
jgi:hypothetical protein